MLERRSQHTRRSLDEASAVYPVVEQVCSANTLSRQANVSRPAPSTCITSATIRSALCSVLTISRRKMYFCAWPMSSEPGCWGFLDLSPSFTRAWGIRPRTYFLIKVNPFFNLRSGRIDAKGPTHKRKVAFLDAYWMAPASFVCSTSVLCRANCRYSF